MTSPRTPVAAGELVPLSERLRHLQLLRVALALAVVVIAFLRHDALLVAPAVVVATIGGYLAVVALCEALWRLARRTAGTVFTAALVVDGLFLAAGSYATGGSASPVRELIVLHLIAVALLASYRTGMKLALWHSILLVVAHNAGAPAARGSLGQLLGFSAVLWLVALLTATFSAVNERELRRRRYDLEVLARMAHRLEEAETPLDVAAVLVDTAEATFALRRAVVLASPDGAGDQLTMLCRRGSVGETDVDLRRSAVLRRAIAEGRPQLVTGLDPRADAALAAVLPGARKLVVVPLAAGGGARGVIVLEHAVPTAGRVERRVVGMLERYAAHAALALRNAWLLEEIRRHAATDGLTGLANRASFDAALERELARAQRSDGQLAVLMLDVDHFKQLNDTHGHQAGDDVLRGLGALLPEMCRPYDVVARYGGEEFAVVLPQTDAAEAVVIAERLRTAVEHAPWHPAVTVSVGVASFPGAALDAAGLLRAADTLLYTSKRAGRNRVTAAAAAPLRA